MHWIDYSIIFLYIAFAIGVGIYFSGKAAKDSESFFLGGRSLPWWAICLSMIATSFASDTPIWVTEVTRKDGLERMWWVIVSVLPPDHWYFPFFQTMEKNQPDHRCGIF